jgi:hypothetical protein
MSNNVELKRTKGERTLASEQCMNYYHWEFYQQLFLGLHSNVRAKIEQIEHR